ncbi:beta-aspartyl-peptidase [[Clostridium] innocuum]|nr:beta-aspartyl-peptidase [[Clostridium] innocuum]
MLLIKNVHLYAPEDLGVQDVLIVQGRIAHIEKNMKAVPYMDILDGSGKRMTPGLIDRHVHVTGGGGEGGFATRTPQIQLSSLIQAGITTVVGLLGTDGITRSMEDLLAKVKALKQEGISAYAMSGSYAVPSTTVTGSVKKDIMFLDEILGVKLALSDHRSSHIAYEDFLKLASEVRTAGMLSNKPGCMTLHMGDEQDDLAYVMKAIRNTGLPCTMFHPTHVTRNDRLFQRALQLLHMGGTIDITCDPHTCSAVWIRQANPKDYGRITLSSDGQGSWSTYDTLGNLTAIGVSSVSVLLQDIQTMLQNHDLSITECLSFVTANPAQILGLYPKKGCIRAGSDADLLLFDNEWQLQDVMAKGTWLMRNQTLLKKGTFE